MYLYITHFELFNQNYTSQWYNSVTETFSHNKQTTTIQIGGIKCSGTLPLQTLQKADGLLSFLNFKISPHCRYFTLHMSIYYTTHSPFTIHG